MSKRKSNKKVKQMMFSVMAEKFNCSVDDFWFEDGKVMRYEPPMGHFEGDEFPFWWQGYGFEFTSLTANQLNTNKDR